MPPAFGKAALAVFVVFVKNLTIFGEIKINININILYFYINKINCYVENSPIFNFHTYHCANFNF